MNPISLTFSNIRSRIEQLGPGSKSFLTSLSWVTLYFGLSKVFSSLATVIVARYLGALNFGEAQIVLVPAQMFSLFTLFGMHVVVMRYSAGKNDPAPVIATSFYISVATAVISGSLAWLFREKLGSWLPIGDYELIWIIGLAVLFCFYLLLTSVYQALHYFQQRGLIEVVFASLMLPGLAIGHILTKGGYETLLIAYAVAYGVTIVPMLWKFRHAFSPRNLFAPELKEMLLYGGLSCVCNVGYILTFIVQPMQLEHYLGTKEFGVFRLYSYGSLNMAALATSVVAAVLFPKASAVKDRLGVWRRMNKAWLKLWIPLLAAFVVIATVVVLLAGKDFPLVWSHVFLFAVASTLITVQSTYAQIMAAQGVVGMRWGLLLSVISGGVNLLLSIILIPRYGINGAVLALIANYAITLIGTFLVRDVVLKEAAVEPATSAE